MRTDTRFERTGERGGKQDKQALRYVLTRDEQVLAWEAIVQNVWGPDVDSDDVRDGNMPQVTTNVLLRYPDYPWPTVESSPRAAFAELNGLRGKPRCVELGERTATGKVIKPSQCHGCIFADRTRGLLRNGPCSLDFSQFDLDIDLAPTAQQPKRPRSGK